MMHELSVCAALLDQVSRLAQQHGASGVSTVSLRLGPLSGVDPQLLQRAYYQARRGTPAHQAGLVIITVPLRIACLRCGTESQATPGRLSCANCGSARTQLLSGDELLIDSVDLVIDGHMQLAAER